MSEFTKDADRYTAIDMILLILIIPGFITTVDLSGRLIWGTIEINFTVT